MEKERDKQIYKQLVEYKKILIEKGYDVLYVGLYGSQNYNVDDENSDIDARAIVMPVLEDIITRKKISKKVITEYGEVDVKDLMTYYEVIRKGNFSFLEPLRTKWFIGEKIIREMFSDVPINLKSLAGAMFQKQKAFKNNSPSKQEEFKKWGCDPKQLHHIIRLKMLTEEIYRTNDFTLSYIEYSGAEREMLINVKRNYGNIIKKERLENCIDGYIELVENLIGENYKYESIDLYDVLVKFVVDRLKVKILKDSEFDYARVIRTFGTPIPKKDREKFPILNAYNGKDITYTVHESLDIL